MACRAEKRVVSDQEYEAALADKDISDMLVAETLKYAEHFDASERRELALDALWKALQDHRPEFGKKFTTSLWQFIHWECRRRLRASRRRVARERRADGDIRDMEDRLPLNRKQSDEDTKLAVREKLALLPRNVRKIVTQYYWENRTIDEIAYLNKCTRENTRRSLRLGEARLGELLGGVNPMGGIE